MSDNNKDKPDDYESIFSGEDNSLNSQNGQIIDAETNDSIGEETIHRTFDVDGILQDEKIDDEADDDLEDGIFAQDRRGGKPEKKSSSLMLVVSILALVAVAGAIYVYKPNLFEQVTQNITSPEIVILPSSQENEGSSISEEAPNIAMTPEGPQQLLEEPDRPSLNQDEFISVPPSDQAPLAVAELDENLNGGVTESSLKSTEELKSDSVVAPEILQSPPLDVAQIDVNQAVPVVENPPVDTKANVVPIPADLNSVPSLEDKKVEIDVSKVAVPIEKPNVKNSVDSMPPKTEEIKPIIQNSKEEQKVIDDANLDKYFDSPGGKILSDIPAPSMDPKKGSRESLIIVNKKSVVSTQNKSAMAKVEIESTSLNSQIISADRAVRLGRFDAAKKMYDDLYRMNPKDGKILSGRAILLQRMGLDDQAIEAYEEILSLFPNNSDAIVNLSGLIRKQYPAVALGKLLDLHMQYPSNPMVTAQLGVAYADSGNFPDAFRYLDKAAMMDPKNPQHYFNMAVVSEKAGQSKNAVVFYEKSLELDSIYGEGQKLIPRERIYDRLSKIRTN